MNIFLFFILIILIIFLVCSIVSVVQFLIDLHKNSDMLQELKNAIKRVEKIASILDDKESVDADERLDT